MSNLSKAFLLLDQSVENLKQMQHGEWRGSTDNLLEILLTLGRVKESLITQAIRQGEEEEA